MSDYINENLEKTIKEFADKLGVLSSSFDMTSLKTYEQLKDLFKEPYKFTMSESLIDSLVILEKTSSKITNLQKIAISKEVKPSLLELSKDQEKIRKQITKKQAKVLVKSENIDILGSGFTYKNTKISQDKVKEAIEATYFFDDITVDEIIDFSSFIYKYPYLAVDNNVGKRIFDMCSDIKEEYLTIIDPNAEFYRARKMNNPDEPFTEEEMGKAPFKIPGQGRFNTQGVSRFYLSQHSEDAVSEVKKHSSKEESFRVQIAKYRNSDKLKMLDMQKMDNSWSEKCLRSVNNPGPFNVEYLCSGYLAQCLEYYNNIDGILYGKEGHSLYMFYNASKFDHISMAFSEI